MTNDTKLNFKFIELYLSSEYQILVFDIEFLSSKISNNFPVSNVSNTIDFNRSYDLATSLYTPV